MKLDSCPLTLSRNLELVPIGGASPITSRIVIGRTGASTKVNPDGFKQSA
jgi:hypothetical protein